MAHIRAEALVGGAEDLLSRPRRVVDHRRLGDPGDSLDASGAVGRLLRVEEVPLVHADVAPDVRERLSHLTDGDGTAFVHYPE